MQENLHLSPSFGGRMNPGEDLAEKKGKIWGLRGQIGPYCSSVLNQAVCTDRLHPPLISFVPTFSKPQETKCLLLGFRKIQWALLPNSYSKYYNQ